MSSALPTTKGAITQLELPSRAFRTHLTVRSRILKRYLKETFCLSFPFLCSPGASDITKRYKLRNARICELGAAVRFFFFHRCHRLVLHCCNFIDSGSDCVFRCSTGVKDNLCCECLFHGNWESGTPCQHYSFHRTKGQDPAIRLT